MEDAIERLREAIGAEYVIPGNEAPDCAHDASFIEGSALAVAYPASTEDVVRIVDICRQIPLPIIARGSGTSLVGGPLAVQGGLVVSFDRMNRIEIDVPNVCAIAQPGAITADLQGAAAAEGLMYPPDPGSVHLSTLGGNVACNAGGMCCVKYGVTADYVIGMTVVLADGTVLNLGGKIRKRASGYRLLQLFIGSEGTLGIVTELIMKLVPLPRFRATAIVGYASMTDAAEAVSRLLAGGHFPSALEILDRHAVELLAEHLPPGFVPDLDGLLIVETDGNHPDHVAEDLTRMTDLLGGVDRRIAASEDQRDGVWKARRYFGRILMSMPKNYFAEDVAVPISQIPEMVRRVQALAESTGLSVATVGHAGDGNLHPTIFFTDDQRDLVAPVAAQIFRDAIELGGTISAEHGLGSLKRDYAELEHGSEAIAIMRAVKRTLDPDGLLNPHKVFPGGPPDDEFLARLPGWSEAVTIHRSRDL